MVGGGSPMRGEERERREKAAVQSGIFFFFFFFFFFLKKPIHLIGEWRHQMGVLGEFKRGVDVAHGDWFGVREGTHLLGVHPLHPKTNKIKSKTTLTDTKYSLNYNYIH
ncbi:hypothetical protein Hanom_Chr06g00488201 [Helianthus anomalus]